MRRDRAASARQGAGFCRYRRDRRLPDRDQRDLAHWYPGTGTLRRDQRGRDDLGGDRGETGVSLRRHILNLSLRLLEKRHLARADDPAKLRAMFERKARFWFRPPRGSHFSGETIDGVQVCWALGKEVPARATAPVILYLHGGGYVFGSSRTHRAMLARLSGLSGLAACLPDYRLAPEHAFPAALEDALSVYIELSQKNRGVVIGGDSAGGGLALSLMAEIAKHGLKKPMGCFAFSPLADVGFTG